MNCKLLIIFLLLLSYEQICKNCKKVGNEESSYSKAGAAAQSFWIERTRGTMAEATNQNTENK
jgi:hypothetical protein